MVLVPFPPFIAFQRLLITHVLWSYRVKNQTGERGNKSYPKSRLHVERKDEGSAFSCFGSLNKSHAPWKGIEVFSIWVISRYLRVFNLFPYISHRVILLFTTWHLTFNYINHFLIINAPTIDDSDLHKRKWNYRINQRNDDWLGWKGIKGFRSTSWIKGLSLFHLKYTHPRNGRIISSFDLHSSLFVIIFLIKSAQNKGYFLSIFLGRIYLLG